MQRCSLISGFRTNFLQQSMKDGFKLNDGKSVVFMFEFFRVKMSNILTVVGWTKAFLKMSLWDVRKVVSILTLKKTIL